MGELNNKKSWSYEPGGWRVLGPRLREVKRKYLWFVNEFKIFPQVLCFLYELG